MCVENREFDRITDMKEIPRPCKKELKKYLKEWGTLENYSAQEKSLEKLFKKTYPNNKNLDDILVKVASLITFYGLVIHSPFTVAKHVQKIDVDQLIKKGDLDIVNKIAKVKMRGGNTKNFYSFATKYCSFHNPNKYPIYDSYLEKVLMHFKREDSFSKFKKYDLKKYSEYKRVLLDFIDFYDLGKISLKDLDRYLWQLGKEHFPKNY